MKEYINKQFYFTLTKIGLPIVLQSFVTSFLSIIDTFMISSLSAASIAGVGAANRIYFLLHLFLFGASTGAAVLASQYWGAKDIKSIRKVLGLTLTLAVGGAILFCAAVWLLPEEIMRAFTPEEGVIAEGVLYLGIIVFAYIPSAITFAYAFILRTTHQVLMPVLVSITALLTNTFLNWVLIYGNLGAPAMGVRGAAIATVIARLVEMIAVLGFTYALDMPAAAKLKELFDWDKSFVLKFFKTATPVIANEMLWAVGVTGYALVYGRMGETVMASMTISQTIEQIAFILFFGMSSAGSVMLGNALGGGELHKAAAYGKRLIQLFIGIGIMSGLILYFISPLIVGIYNVEPEVKETVILALHLLAFFVPMKGLNLLLIVGVLRSGGDTVAAMLIDMVAVWGVGLPLAIITGIVFKLDIRVVYTVILMEELFKVFIALYRYKKGKWIKNLVEDGAH